VTDIAISSYSFHRLVKSGEVRLEDTPRLARECGADAIEIATGGTLGPALDEAMAARLADAADAADVAIVGFALAADLLDEAGGTDEAAVQEVIAQVRAAASIGVDRVRHDAAWRGANDDCSDEAWDAALWPLTKACRTIATAGAASGVRTSIENHGLFLAAAWRVQQLLEQVQHPNFGVTLDLGNLLWAPQDIVESTRSLAPHAVTVHVKDFKSGSSDPAAWPTYPGGPKVLPVALGAGDLPLPAQIDAILDADVSPLWVAEFEGPHGDVHAEAKRSFEWLRKQLG
jgi:sugar phosphate isomerase/epimerase